ncbi:MAG: OsmC family protein [Hyphomicrobiales bacterium]|nr:OsmC family protein [Hyphomicrobiales bacterium]
MTTRTSNAEWKGNLKDGAGTVSLGSGAFSGSYSFPSRFETGDGTNPEELIAAAHAACYSMALAHALSTAGFVPNAVKTTARVRLEQVADGFAITHIVLDCLASVPNISTNAFQDHAQSAKTGCPVSKALAATEITLNATLE